MEHDHDGHCRGQLRLEAGRLVGEVICEVCGHVFPRGSTPYVVPPYIEVKAA